MKPHFRPLIALALVIVSFPAGAAPVISEFQADNKDTITDEDGATADWIEIYNPDAVPVSLEGMALTDDPLLLQKWIFPAVTLGPRSRLLVWASAKNRLDPAAPLHTNFDLALAGEYLALVAADGATKLTEFDTYPPQSPDRSYGSTSEVTVTERPIAKGAPCKWLVPSDVVNGWETLNFDDSSWTPALTAIGYDTNTAGTVDFNFFIGEGGNVLAMRNINATCYVRLPFTFSGSSTDVSAMILWIKFDDGFAPFLNGTRLNPPTAGQTNAPAALTWNSAAPLVQNDTYATVTYGYDLSNWKHLLVDGTNVFAIQSLNATPNSSDLLLLPELEIVRVLSSATTSTGYFKTPTPGTANLTAPVANFVEEVGFDIKRGIYTAPQQISLTCPTPNAEIRYTTNGSAPTAATGTVYTGPIQVSGSTVLRAAAFVSGWEPSPVKTHSYIFGESAMNQPAAPDGYPTTWGTDDRNQLPVPGDYLMDPGITGHQTYGPLIVPSITNTLPILCLSADIEELFGYPEGIYSNGRLGLIRELSASMEYFEPGGAANWQENAGLRLHGGDAPYEHPKKPFRVYFRKQYGEGRLRHSLFPGSPVDSFDKLQIRPMGHDSWAVPFGSGNESLARHALYCRDRFLRQTELDMGRLAHHGKYVNLFINGLYWGFYDLHEVQSKEYWADHKGGKEEDWDVVEHSNANVPLFDVVDGRDKATNATLDLVRPATRVSDAKGLETLGHFIDYNEFIDNMIVQMWGAQNDWMGPVYRGTPGVNLTDATRFTNKNWQAARRSRGTDPGHFFWQVWDAEISMGNSLTQFGLTMRISDFNHTLVGTPTTDITHITGQPGSPGPAAEIWYALRKFNPAFRMMVADRLQKHFFNDGAMTTAKNLARLQSFRDLLDLPLAAESARWGDVNTGQPLVVTFTRDEHWRSEMNWVRDTYIPTRNNTMLTQMRAIGMWPTVTAPVLSKFGGEVAAGHQLTITDPNAAGGTVYYTLDGSDPMGGIASANQIVFAGPSVNTNAFYRVPSSTPTSNSWKNMAAPSDIANWSQGPLGLGFDANATFGPHIRTPIAGMRNVRASVYIRIPFTVTAAQKAAITSLTLKLKYDDGAYVFLNGSTVPVFRLNASPTATPAFTDVATASRADADAVQFQSFDLSALITTLSTSATNVLAIQGLNISAADDDFLCVPELVGSTTPASAPAQPYQGPVTLSQTGTVKARVLRSGVWSPLTEASFIVGQAASAANLVISEFSYNPKLTDEESAAGYTAQKFEFIELLNLSSSPIELTGCRFDDGIKFEFTTHSSVQTIPGRGRILLVSDAAAFAARHPGVPIAGVFQEDSNLANSGERLELIAANGSAIVDFVYDDDAPWPASPDGQGFSLVLINPLTAPDPAIATNWRASLAPGGNPGGTDSDTFSAWSLRNSISGYMTDDPDMNGLSSLAEYGLGVEAGSGDTAAPFSARFETVNVAGTPGTYLVLRYRRNGAADDVVVTPQMSTDMVNWIPLTDPVRPETSYPNGTQDLVRRSPQPVSAGTRLYVRVSITAAGP